jgi:tetrahydromethanopterin S-methyltransferase subunit A
MGDDAGKIMAAFARGMALAKCRRCGCMASALAQAAGVLCGQDRETVCAYQQRMEAIAYDCFGCKRCWGAEAAIRLADRFGGDLPSCGGAIPAEAPVARLAIPAAVPWPPYPGDYHLGHHDGAVAVCTLSDRQLPAAIIAQRQPAIAIAGRCDTENIGIEKIILNLIGHPRIRRLILCGREAPGHRAGDALLRLSAHGVDESMRIVGASGWRPVLKNVLPEEVARFREQITVIERIGMTDPAAVARVARRAAAFPAPPLAAWSPESKPHPVARIAARAPARLQLDPAGYFVILLDRQAGLLSCEHYANDGTLQHTIEGVQADLIAATVVERGLVTRLDHAAYLGRELAKAGMALAAGTPYEQDAALGELADAAIPKGDSREDVMVETAAADPCAGRYGCGRNVSADTA